VPSSPFPRALEEDEKKRAASPSPAPPPAPKPEEYRFKRGEHIGKSLTEAPWQYLWYLVESGESEKHEGLEQAVHKWWSVIILSGASSRGPTANETTLIYNWRIPSSAARFEGWLFRELPVNDLVFLSHELSQNRLQDGEWEPLYRAFERHWPNLLPGERWKTIQAARARAQAQEAGGFSQQPPTGPCANRERAQQPPPKGSRPRQGVPTNGATLKVFSLETKDFEFPERDPDYAWRRLDQLPQDDFVKVVHKFMKKRYRGAVYKGLKEAIEALWPEYRTQCY
jgi:hypothetical protein